MYRSDILHGMALDPVPEFEIDSNTSGQRLPGPPNVSGLEWFKSLPCVQPANGLAQACAWPRLDSILMREQEITNPP